MSYYYGDRFRHYLDQQGYLAPQPVVKIISHCGLMDNAYYNSLSNEVCLGDSFQSLDSFYADDSAVNLHEIQHGTTIDLYKGATGDYFNHFFADESGALNEAISDFMSMAFVARDVSAPNDPRDFSRWALQSFMSQDASRGAHLCPRYDSAFPDCTSYENGAVGFSADLGHVSYAYPDGLGWPFGRNMSGPGYLKNAFENFRDQEEIHNLAVIATGALWDGFEALREIDDDETALALMTRAVMEAIVHLPPPSDDLKAPITFIRFFDLMVQWAEVVGFSVQQKNALIAAFEKRGLYQFTSLPSDWGSVGAGASSSPGMKIEDHPNLVKNWIFATGGDPSAVTHSLGTGLNGRLSPGEMVAIWFDIQNNSALTAGSTLIRVRSDHPAIELFNQNIGYVSANAASVPEVQMRYYKINGTEVVSRLSSANPSLHVPTGNSYFKTNPFFYLSPRTAIFIKVSSTAVEGDRIPFQVVVQPENGPEIELIYEAEVDGA